MSSTRKSVLDGMDLHASAQKASLVTVVLATSATSDMPVLGGSDCTVAESVLPMPAQKQR